MRNVAKLALILALAAFAPGCRRGEAQQINGLEAAVAPHAVRSAPRGAAPQAPARDVINPRLLRRFRPVAGVVAPPPAAPALVDLGRMLWYDTRLSRSNTISCNSCHKLSAYGMDNKPTSVGDHGQHGRRNAPTVYNAADHFAQFWDGRARDLEEQAKGPILNPVEMASGRAEVEGRLRAIPGYRDRFRAAFPGQGEPINLANVTRALGAFERGLTTFSRWDQYVAGNDAALTNAEVHGLRVFLDVGCMACHTGPEIGGSMFQTLGSVRPWPSQKDLGREEVTHLEIDRMKFKVPTLKNVTRTAPYLHDGSVATLAEAVRLMARHQIGIELGDDEVAAIVTFLGALEGELPEAYILEPALPHGT